jgi:hypothetical protein
MSSKLLKLTSVGVSCTHGALPRTVNHSTDALIEKLISIKAQTTLHGFAGYYVVDLLDDCLLLITS